MAISKIIYKQNAQDTGTVWMDTTDKTVDAGSMLSGITALKNDGTTATGNIASKTSSDLTASGATVTAPAGYYASAASKSVASGTEGTPTATKGTVSNHSVTVTPSVTNTAGYISGGTKTGTAVTVDVSELESGTKSITANGTGISVSGYSAVDVAVPSSSPTLITKSITANGTYNAQDDSADGYSSVTVNVSGGGGGLEYETGTYTPAEDVARPTINFANTHSDMPVWVMMTDATGTYDSTTYTNYLFSFFDSFRLTGQSIYKSATDIENATFTYRYRSTNASVLTGSYVQLTQPRTSTNDSSSVFYRYNVSESWFKPHANDTSSRYWRAGHTYKWIAVWAPST